MHDHGFHTLRVSEARPETDSAMSIALEVPDELRDVFGHLPGQFLNVRIVAGGRSRMRCYSLCSSPHTGEPLRIAVKRVDGGLVSNELCNGIKQGMTLEVQPPSGHFVPRTLNEDLLLFAGGSGITPVFSILKSALAVGTGKITLVYANRDERSVIFGKEIAALAAGHPERLVVLHWLESVQGLPVPGQLAQLVRPWSTARAFICGPEPFMQAVSAALGSIGVASDRVHLERFVSLPDADDASAARPAGEGSDAALDVSLDGEAHELHWPAGSKLLDTMLEGGIDAPFSCRVGGCSACMCRVTAGQVQMAINLVLTDDEIAEGWTLACQAYAVSSSVSIEI